MSWTPPQGNYETFSVQLKLNASNKEVETENTTNSQLSFTKLKAGAEYLVTVTTLNGYLKSYPISTANFTRELRVNLSLFE